MHTMESLAGQSLFARIGQLADNPMERVSRLATDGHRLLGLVCPNLPEELPHALGLVPTRIVLRPTPPTRSPEVLQTFCCTWVQALLDQGMRGELVGLCGITFSCNTCDSLQNLPDLWRRTVTQPSLLYSLRFPVQGQGQPALEMLRAEIQLWRQALEHLTGEPLQPSRLERSARLFNRIRGALRRLQQLALCGEVGYSVLQAAAVASQTHPREEVLELLETAVEHLAHSSSALVHIQRGVPSPRVVLVGSYLDHPRLLQWLERHQVTVVGDDSCSLSRTFEPAADLDPADPLADMARRHQRRSPCPVQLQSAARRAAALSQTVRRGSAEGVVLLPYKGCEPHAFDNVILAQSLDQLGVPHITLEIDPHLGGWGQITTRLEAFVEMLSGLGDDELYPDSQTGRP